MGIHCRFIWLSNGSWHALLFAIRDIAAGEELTFDYQLVTEDPDEPQLKLLCRCAAERCRGTLFTYREW
jgi:SET domain-containing protein